MASERRRWLLLMKLALSKGSPFVIWERAEIKQTMLDLGLNTQGLKLQLLELNAADCIWGPGPDDDPARTGDVAIFAPLVGEPGTRVYVKVKLITADSGSSRVECLSFHYPHYPVRPRQEI